MMLPSEKSGKKVLKCNLCGSFKNLNQDLKEAYTFKTEIKHPTGSEFKNIEEEKKWIKKRKKKKKSEKKKIKS